MENGECRHKFPKDFNAETRFDDSKIYLQYRRRSPEQGGATYEHRGRVIDNRWITPYSPYLLLTYECHLNVEVCVSVESVKSYGIKATVYEGLEAEE